MADSAEPIVLNANQRRHLEVLFARLEDSLIEIETLLGDPASDRRALTILVDDLPSGFRDRAEADLRHLHEDIIELSGRLELRPRRVSRLRAIASLLTSQAVRVEDSLGLQLRGYGDLDASVVERLDPKLRGVAGQLAGLRSYLGHSRDQRSSGR